MTRLSNPGLDALHGQRLVDTWSRERRKTAHELARMSHEDRLLYEISHPLNDAERQAELEREHAIAEYELDGELIVGSILYDDGPGDWD